MGVIFPSSNRLGIPDLLPQRLDGVPVPVRGWGTTGRRGHHGGTWHFYVDDYRFAAALKNPDAVVRTGCAAAVEPNVSVFDDTPLAVALETVYRKRQAARYFQGCGLAVFLDLNMPARVLDAPEWAGGVPAGWNAFATRAYGKRPEHLDSEYEVALRFCDRPLFLVAGGGRDTAAWCVARGAHHSGYRSTKRPYGGAAAGVPA